MITTNWRNSYIRTKVGLKAFSFLKSVGKIPYGKDSERYWWRWAYWWEKTKETNYLAAVLLVPRIYLTMGNPFLYYLLNNCWIKLKSLKH